MPIAELIIETPGPGLHEITDDVARSFDASAIGDGLCTIFIRHTSASLVIQENADPTARRDLDAFFQRLVPEGDPRYTHTSEGPDDMPAHIKAALTATSIGIPIVGGRLTLGTWQGIYLFEHRARRHRRKVVVHTTS